MSNTWTAIGLMSGTSTDGISAAIVRLRPTAAGGYRHHLLAFRTTPYRQQLRDALLHAAEGGSLPAAAFSELNVRLGARLAAAAVAVARRAGIPLHRVDVIGSHGHTIFHGPPGSRRSAPPSTWQIGEPSVIAARTGVTTVADFRPVDVALGGQGAPLVPYVHWLLFTHPTRGRAIHNVGGIANLTYLPPHAECDAVLAFDTGPGNMVIDAVVASHTHGKMLFDRNGAIAAAGRVDEAIVGQALAHPFFKRRPPKSTGREQFGAELVENLLRRARRARLRQADVVATATAITARSMADAYERFVLPRGPLAEIQVAGGGARNATLMRMLRELLPGIRVTRLDALGVQTDTIEAISFAVLACEAVRGRPANIPTVTGARGIAVLGKVVPGDPAHWHRIMRRAGS